MKRPIAGSGDSGSVLPLTLGFLVIITMAVGVVVDASSVFLKRRALAAVADGAALAGAQSIDVEAYYRRGAGAALRPDPERVQADVRAYLRASDLPEEAVVERVAVQDGTVVVRLRTTVQPPLTSWLGADFTVRAEAGAQMRLG